MNMKRSSLAAALVLLTAGSLWAHHAISAVFDTTKQIKIVGELTDVDWVNPHIFIHLKAKNSAGAMVSWKAESGPPAWYRPVPEASGPVAVQPIGHSKRKRLAWAGKGGQTDGCNSP